MMRSWRTLDVALILGLAGVTVAVACSTGPSNADPATDDGNLGILSVDEVIGTLAYGQTSAPTPYTSVPRYRAYSFVGHAQDNVDIWVRSTDGVAMAWLVKPDGQTLAYDFASNHDAHIVQKLPADGTHFIAFREASLTSATFTVSLALAPVDVLDAGADVDATLDATSDGDITDGATDGASDGDSGVVVSNVTCTYMRVNQTGMGCPGCNLPTQITAQDNNVPIIIRAGPGLLCSNPYPDGRVFEIDGPTTIGAYGPDGSVPLGWSYGNAFDLGYGTQPPFSPDAGPDAGEGYECSGYFPLLQNSNSDASVTVVGDQVNLVTFYGVHYPGVPNCPVIHGCVTESIDCSGTATAIYK